jgi:glycosyltransferase involved in cell wall biosynthesis
MKILWVKSDFLHPTNYGGQIRTLEIVKRLHRDHEVHYMAYDHPRHPDALGRAGEYSTRSYPVKLEVPPMGSAAFAGQLLVNLFSDQPLSVSRYRSAAMQGEIARLLERVQFDSIVCDFLFPAPNFPALDRCVLFQHNVEQMIWKRHTENARLLKRWFMAAQARRMLDLESRVCREVRHVIAVSEDDAAVFRQQYGCPNVSVIATGVDTDYFHPPQEPVAPVADLIFLGSMNWLPNIDAMEHFLAEIFPLIRRKRPETTLAIVGRQPSPGILALANRTPGVSITGTVPDVRPYL